MTEMRNVRDALGYGHADDFLERGKSILWLPYLAYRLIGSMILDLIVKSTGVTKFIFLEIK